MSQYLQIWNGNNQYLTEDRNQNKLSKDEFKQIFFAQPLLQLISEKQLANKEFLLPCTYLPDLKFNIIYQDIRSSDTENDGRKRFQLTKVDLEVGVPVFLIGGYKTGDRPEDPAIFICYVTGFEKINENAQTSSYWIPWEKLVTIYNKGVCQWRHNKDVTVIGCRQDYLMCLIQTIVSHALLNRTITKNVTIVPHGTDLPFQRIYYGAPGTGKSCETNKIVREYSDTIRTTFHPDSDYSTFVGAYKPTMEYKPIRDSSGNITLDKNKDEMYEERISYQFIQQAFVKAYVLAWKKMAKATTSTSLTSTEQPIEPIVLFADNQRSSWKIININDNDLYLEKTSRLDLSDFKHQVKEWWSKCWQGGTFNLILHNFRRHEISVCLWMNNNIEGIASFHNDFDRCWNLFLLELDRHEIAQGVTEKGKSYVLSKEGSEIIIKNKQHTTSDSICAEYEDDKEEKSDSSYLKAIANLLKRYDRDDFDKAWSILQQQVLGSANNSLSASFAAELQFLVIEEINRGNCAQIFGDLFQLLDRKDGFSEYPIEADRDLAKCIKKELIGLEFAPEITTYINNLYVDNEQNPQTYLVDNLPVFTLQAIQNGKILVLPNNLYIWATMNTSDQSLFPIDSAFKRRWDWKYIGIVKGKDEAGNELDWHIADGTSWWDFIIQMNKIIAELTSSADKQLGYFFCKAENNEISYEKFVNKVCFYLWSDVFKDFSEGSESFLQHVVDENKNITATIAFSDFFDQNDVDKINEDLVKEFISNVINWSKEEVKDKK